jgi:protein TonB
MRSLCWLVSVGLHGVVAVLLPPHTALPAAHALAEAAPPPVPYLVLPQRPLPAAVAGGGPAARLPLPTPPQPRRAPSPGPRRHQARPNLVRPAVEVAASPAAAGVAVAIQADPQPDPAGRAVESAGATAAVGTDAGQDQAGEGDSGSPHHSFGTGVGGDDDPLTLDGDHRDPQLRAWLAALRRRLQRAHYYPEWLADRGIEGTLHLRIELDEHGRVRSVSSPQGRDQALLLEAAREVLAAAEPLPPPPAGVGPVVRLHLPLTFALRDEL